MEDGFYHHEADEGTRREKAESDIQAIGNKALAGLLVGRVLRCEAASVCNQIVAGLAAGRTIKQPVLAKADFNLRLAQAAILFALAFFFRHFALHAAVF
jgi:hypothetical protein